MIVDCYDPVNLFEMVPKLNLEMEPELAELDRLLEDDAICERVKKDLSKSETARRFRVDRATLKRSTASNSTSAAPYSRGRPPPRDPSWMRRRESSS